MPVPLTATDCDMFAGSSLVIVIVALNAVPDDVPEAGANFTFTTRIFPVTQGESASA